MTYNRDAVAVSKTNESGWKVTDSRTNAVYRFDDFESARDLAHLLRSAQSISIDLCEAYTFTRDDGRAEDDMEG